MIATRDYLFSTCTSCWSASSTVHWICVSAAYRCQCYEPRFLLNVLHGCEFHVEGSHGCSVVWGEWPHNCFFAFCGRSGSVGLMHWDSSQHRVKRLLGESTYMDCMWEAQYDYTQVHTRAVHKCLCVWIVCTLWADTHTHTAHHKSLQRKGSVPKTNTVTHNGHFCFPTQSFSLQRLIHLNESPKTNKH